MQNSIQVGVDSFKALGRLSLKVSRGWVPMQPEDRAHFRGLLQSLIVARRARVSDLPVSGGYDHSSLAEDIIRIKLQPHNWRALRRFRGHPCHQVTEKAFYKYLDRITTNYIKDLLRSRSVRQDFQTYRLGDLEKLCPEKPEWVENTVLCDPTQPTPFEILVAREELSIIARKISELSNPIHRQISELLLQGLTPAEIAEEIDATSNTVSVFLCRFRVQVRAAIEA